MDGRVFKPKQSFLEENLNAGTMFQLLILKLDLSLVLLLLIFLDRSLMRLEAFYG